MSALFPGTPVVPPGEESLLDHVSRHYFNKSERWGFLGDMTLTLSWSAGFRELRANGWKGGEGALGDLPEGWRSALVEGSGPYCELTLLAVQEAVEAKRVFPCEPVGGALELRLSYVGRCGIFVVAAAAGAQRPFRTAFRVQSPARLKRGKLDNDTTFLANAKEHAHKRLPRDLARWEARAVRRQQRLASTPANPSDGSGPDGRHA